MGTDRRIITTLEDDGMVEKYICFAIASLIACVLEYFYVLVIDLTRYSFLEENIKIAKMPVSRAVVVLRWISGCYCILSSILAILIGVYFGETPLILCMFIEWGIHILYVCILSILGSIFYKKTHYHNKWL